MELGGSQQLARIRCPLFPHPSPPRRLLGVLVGLPGSSDAKESACNIGDPCLVPGLGRSPGEGNGNPIQCSCLENLMDRGAWRAAAYRITRVGHDWSDLAHRIPNDLLTATSHFSINYSWETASITEALRPSFLPPVKLSSEQLSDQPSWRTGIHRPVCCSPQEEEARDCETRGQKTYPGSAVLALMLMA